VDELEIQGKKYISSKRAAELTGYAKDYVGQLARGGKIPGTRVGRAWYVQEAALLLLAGAPIQEQTGTASESISKAAIEPGRTLYSIHALPHVKNKGNEVFGTWRSVSYLTDEDPLLPSLVSGSEIKINAEIASKNIVFPGIVRETRVPISDIKTGAFVSTDGIVLKTKVPEKTPLINATMRRNTSTGSAYLLVGGGLFALTFLALWSGSFNPSHWSFSVAPSMTSAAQDSISTSGGAYIQELFTQGIDLIRSFMAVMSASFGTFFTSGLNFVVNLFHLG
jgi:hypothetical protein